ncbi:hypothetical protein EYF80_045376 [Liparis tanakae]|uniref:Uncharacterized protein n=1 Tax=Liparis tanakae TaxID=230148 RepID=A0A4Z2FVQ9_9TELE|nr:hypothetical protein EYF80_045376 [Liparis tanakae]
MVLRGAVVIAYAYGASGHVVPFRGTRLRRRRANNATHCNGDGLGFSRSRHDANPAWLFR